MVEFNWFPITARTGLKVLVQVVGSLDITGHTDT